MDYEKEINRLKVKCNTYAKRLVSEGFDNVEWEATSNTVETINNSPTDRENLEWIVYHSLKSESPCITISRGRELLGFLYMDNMREWMQDFETKYKRINFFEGGQNARD